MIIQSRWDKAIDLLRATGNFKYGDGWSIPNETIMLVYKLLEQAKEEDSSA